MSCGREREGDENERGERESENWVIEGKGNVATRKMFVERFSLSP